MKIRLVLWTLCLVSFCGCGRFMMNKSALLKLEKGMTKEEVVVLLGEPDFRRFNREREEWEYKKENPVTSEKKVIVVGFINNRVSNMNSFDGNYIPTPPVDVYPPEEVEADESFVYPLPPKGQHTHAYAMNNKDFELLYAGIEKEPFAKGRIQSLELAIVNKYFTSKQCVQLMSLFPFNGDKLKALHLLAPHILDSENYIEIVNSFPFSSDREKAREELTRIQRQRRE